MTMKIITKQDLVDSVARRWEKQYKDSFKIHSHAQPTLRRLQALTDPTEQQITLLIGNNFWTRNECSECKKDVFAIIQIGDDPDYESDTIWLCTECLLEALSLIIKSSTGGLS